MTSQRFCTMAVSVFLVGATAQAGDKTTTSLSEYAGIAAPAADPNMAAAPASDLAPSDPPPAFNPNNIPANGASFNTDGTSNAIQACKVYTSRAVWASEQGYVVGQARGCAANKCMENADATTAGVGGLLACTAVGGITKVDCTHPAPCGPLVNGLTIQEVDRVRNSANAQQGLLNFGPNWFANDPNSPQGKGWTNNFFNDSLQLTFTGSAGFPVGCTAGTVNPRAVGFDLHNFLNAASNDNIVVVGLSGGGSFAYQARGRSSGEFTGLCCTSDIQSITITNNGAFTEGVDNVQYGTSAACNPPDTGGSGGSCDTTKVEKMLCNVIRLQHTPDGQRSTNDQVVCDTCETCYSWNGTSSCGPQTVPAADPAPTANPSSQCKK